MRRRWGFHTTTAVVAVLALAACGDGGAADPTIAANDPGSTVPVFDPSIILPAANDIGSCPPSLQENADHGTLDFVPLRSRILTPSVVWWRVNRIGSAAGDKTATTTPQDRTIPVTLIGSAGLPGSLAAPPSSARLYGPNLPQVIAAQDAGYTFYVGRREPSTKIESIVAVDGEGRIGFVGQCEAVMSTVTIEGFVKTVRGGETDIGLPRDSSAASIMAAVVQPSRGPASIAFAAWGASTPPAAWVDTPADRRSIDPEVTPAEVMDDLRRLSVAVDLPAEWRTGADVTICTRTVFAWGECTALNVGPSSDPLSITAYLRPAEGFQVWALDGRAAFDSPIGLLATVSSARSDERIASLGTVNLGPAATIGSLEALLNASRAGHPALIET